MTHAEKAKELFQQGYNCSQAIAVAFADLTQIPVEASARMASSFGGGLGRMREICGAVSGMCLVAGILYGYDDPEDGSAKKEHYARVQEMAGAFRAETGSIICRELLTNPKSDPNPTPRTEEFYQKRPCADCVYLAAEILENYIARHPLPQK